MVLITLKYLKYVYYSIEKNKIPLIKILRMALQVLIFFMLSSTAAFSKDIRIATLTPSALGILKSIGAADKVVLDLSKSFGLKVSIESIVASRANFIYGTSHMHEYLYKTFNKKDTPKNDSDGDAIQLFLSNPISIAAVIDEITYIGKLTNCVNGAKIVTDDIKNTLKFINDSIKANSITGTKINPPSVAFFISDEPAIVVGGGTFLDDMLKALNVQNSFGELNGFPLVNKESILLKSPDVIIHTKDYDADLLLQPGAKLSQAIKMLYKIIYIDNKCKNNIL